MSRWTKYEMSIDELVAAAHVPLDQQVEELDAATAPEHDESAGHLPGNLRPYGTNLPLGDDDSGKTQGADCPPGVRGP